MSRAAQAVEAAVKNIKEGKPAVADKADKKPADSKKREKKMEGEKKPRAPKAPREKKVKEPKTRDPLAGIRTAPKLPGVLLGTEVSRAVVEKALKHASCEWSEAEQAEVKRLSARLAARHK